MTQLLLTPERRAQLVELLSNEQRLNVEYPQVAEYLDTAAGLSGTGDDEADRAFDFRMLHYLTGDDVDQRESLLGHRCALGPHGGWAESRQQWTPPGAALGWHTP
ncbi:hypothetical protein [Salinispora arenicola]|uniref:hypothetical protein n=1 Tax=Salinispora arenicola TaxID=168697 RepID=UPI0027DD9595|nr:hypothetical protein [Salinispora arenicola]